MARVGAGMGVRELATSAGVSPNTIARLERGEALRSVTVAAVRFALEAKGIAFLDVGEVAAAPGVCRLSVEIRK